MAVAMGKVAMAATASCIYEKCYAMENDAGLESKTIEIIFGA